MITYEIKINGQTIKRVDVKRIGSFSSKEIEICTSKAFIYDYKKESFKTKAIKHRHSDGCGKLLDLILKGDD